MMKGIDYMKISEVEAMPETAKLWSAIVEATDTTKVRGRKAQLEREKQNLTDEKKLVETLGEFNEKERKIKEIEEEILEVERELEVSKFTIANAHNNLLPKFIDTYNAEFKKYHDEHEKLNAELQKQLTEFYRKIEPTVTRIDEIEKLERRASEVQRFGPPNSTKEYLKLKKRAFTFNRSYSPLNGMSRDFIPNLKRAIRKMKESY